MTAESAHRGVGGGFDDGNGRSVLSGRHVHSHIDHTHSVLLPMWVEYGEFEYVSPGNQLHVRSGGQHIHTSQYLVTLTSDSWILSLSMPLSEPSLGPDIFFQV